MFLAHCINLNTLNTHQNPHSGSARGLVLRLPLKTISQSYKSTIFIVSIDAVELLLNIELLFIWSKRRMCQLIFA